MVKNLPLIIAMFVIGLSALLIGSNSEHSNIMNTITTIMGTVLSLWAMIALLLHIGIKRIEAKKLNQ